MQKSAGTAEGHDAGRVSSRARQLERAGGHDAPSSRRMWARQGRRASQADMLGELIMAKHSSTCKSRINAVQKAATTAAAAAFGKLRRFN